MQYVMQAVPLLVVAGIVALILAPRLRGRIARPQRPARPARPKRTTLRAVPSDRMDDELQDLLRRR